MLRKLFVSGLVAAFSLQSAAWAGIPGWKLLKWSPLWGEVEVYTTDKLSKTIEKKSGMISIFDGNPKYFTAVNLSAKTFHKASYGEFAKMANIANAVGYGDRQTRTWKKVKRTKLIAGRKAEGYKCYLPDGTLDGEVWYFVDRKCSGGLFLAQMFNVPKMEIELAELHWYKNGKPYTAIKTLSVENVTLEPSFFIVPKICKNESGLFGVMNGGMVGIKGIAEDLMGQESRQFRSTKTHKSP